VLADIAKFYHSWGSFFEHGPISSDDGDFVHQPMPTYFRLTGTLVCALQSTWHETIDRICFPMEDKPTFQPVHRISVNAAPSGRSIQRLVEIENQKQVLSLLFATSGATLFHCQHQDGRVVKLIYAGCPGANLFRD
jgi:hypothetical protein